MFIEKNFKGKEILKTRLFGICLDLQTNTQENPTKFGHVGNPICLVLTLF